ncbi:hypothetical protein [Serratia quinivorans]|uniref:hypothetical protein n=1 Tax=Serratia quinivorans TaxID=137545 RepID=UPI00217A07CF|nr:hypothetical protein [Serratia quinivorans]CAI0770062.1 Uncharacterised protein [Serratia quinivorans]CAI1570163.1 Uncharacterised protein [Serratia quinivorans]
MALFRLVMLISSLFVATNALAASPIQLNFDSACDFSQLSIKLKDSLNPGYVQINVELQPQAAQRLATLTTRNNIGKTLITIINGIQVNSATLQSELNSTGLSISTDGPTAQKLFPSLLKNQCEPAQK